MNGNSIVLDTNIVLYLLNGDDELVTILNQMQLYVSVITEIELLAYQEISIQDKAKIKYFLSECIIVPLNDEIKNICIAIKQTSKVKTPDAIVAATSIHNKIPLITSDKGFEKNQNLDLFLYKA
ncbi:type II toxin-antitoxin system VapC family toxin [Flavobacterium eburneipallidum]|uniref:type II toxin-antitoxin system VapC family toxin n=1 Tax=Flavobacterium eburneipallidum TaxID=3003263 RepID=UPI002482B138|nr:type II toxin-antitoxin system VapC family toxin [Flavobacterium eburneipallidum]